MLEYIRWILGRREDIDFNYEPTDDVTNPQK